MHAVAQTVLYCRIPSCLGEVLLTSDGERLTGLYFDGQKDEPPVGPRWRLDEGAAPFARARAQLQAYASGALREFDLPLALNGTPFQQRVWRALCDVGFGRTISYSELARRVGAPKAVRAVAGAVGRNPVSVIVPCHRIVGADGSLTGYSGGLDRKKALLAHERQAASRDDAREAFELRG